MVYGDYSFRRILLAEYCALIENTASNLWRKILMQLKTINLSPRAHTHAHTKLHYLLSVCVRVTALIF